MKLEPPTPHEQERDREDDDLLARRYRYARDCGFNRAEAHTFAESDLDIGRLRDLIDHGCDGATAAQILL